MIYVDADACPVKAEVEQVANRHGLGQRRRRWKQQGQLRGRVGREQLGAWVDMWQPGRASDRGCSVLLRPAVATLPRCDCQCGQRR